MVFYLYCYAKVYFRNYFFIVQKQNIVDLLQFPYNNSQTETYLMDEFLMNLLTPEQIKIFVSIGLGIISLIKLKQVKAIDTYVVSQSAIPSNQIKNIFQQKTNKAQYPAQNIKTHLHTDNYNPNDQKVPMFDNGPYQKRFLLEDIFEEGKTMQQYSEIMYKKSQQSQRQRFNKVFFFQAEKMSEDQIEDKEDQQPSKSNEGSKKQQEPIKNIQNKAEKQEYHILSTPYKMKEKVYEQTAVSRQKTKVLGKKKMIGKNIPKLEIDLGQKKEQNGKNIMKKMRDSFLNSKIKTRKLQRNIDSDDE